MRFFSTLAAIAAAAPAVMAAQASIKNNCPYDVYLWAVDIVRNPSSPSIIAAGASYSEPYRTLATGGVSLKLSKSTDRTHPLQFEYTLAGGFIWYDGSHVDCSGPQCPFYADGVYLEATDATCPTRTCKPNENCTGFYQFWNDDLNTLACNPNASVNMYLCSTSASGKSATSGGSSGGAAAGGAAASSSTAASPAASPSAGKVQMEAVHSMPSTVPHSKRLVHDHMRRHSHQ